MAHYAIGDIHGCFKEFMQMKTYIENEDSQAVFFLVGDIVDRGPNVLDMLTWAMENVTSDGKYQMVLGNHEFELIDWFHYHYTPWLILENMNYVMPETHYDFSTVMRKNNMLNNETLEKIIQFFEERPYYINYNVDGELKYTARIAHAWYPDRKYLPQCCDEEFVWSRLHVCEEFEDLESENAILIHGHTPTQSNECMREGSRQSYIWFKKNSINIDCGCCYKDYEGRLAALRLEDFTEYYCDGETVTAVRKPRFPERKKMEKRFKASE